LSELELSLSEGCFYLLGWVSWQSSLSCVEQYLGHWSLQCVGVYIISIGFVKISIHFFRHKTSNEQTIAPSSW